MQELELETITEIWDIKWMDHTCQKHYFKTLNCFNCFMISVIVRLFKFYFEITLLHLKLHGSTFYMNGSYSLVTVSHDD